MGWGALQGFAGLKRAPFQNTERCCSLMFESKFCPTECMPLLEKQVRPSFGTAHEGAGCYSPSHVLLSHVTT
jgi:hypothetical protein